MSPAPANGVHKSKDTQIICSEEEDTQEENADEKGKSVTSEVIPLKPMKRSSTMATYEDEEAEKVRRIFVTGINWHT